uniref:Uncharacterized protein n=1 Tax=Tetranychus urticae TaxID=32264 RepID=T1K4U2_TETUR
MICKERDKPFNGVVALYCGHYTNIWSKLNILIWFCV